MQVAAKEKRTRTLQLSRRRSVFFGGDYWARGEVAREGFERKGWVQQ